MLEEYPEYWLPAIVTVLVYMLNSRSGIAVGAARDRLRVPVPRMNGPAEFERIVRAHCNNAEQYPQFLALMWTFALVVNGVVAGILGVVWVILRNLYVTEYHKSADRITNYTIPAYLIMTFYSLGIMFSIALAAVKRYL